MKNFKIKKGIEEFKKICLTQDEKSQILSSILQKKVTISVRSPYLIPSYFMIKPRAMSYALVTLVLLVTTVGTSFAAEKAVPGDLLYPIKVSVNEPVVGLLAIDPVSKAVWEVKKAERRLAEAQTLASEGRLTEDKRIEIENRFNEHSEKFNQISNKELESNNGGGGQKNNIEKKQLNLNVGNDLHDKFEADISVETKKLDKIKENSNDEQKKEIQQLQNNIEDKVKKIKEDGNEGIRSSMDQIKKDINFPSNDNRNSERERGNRSGRGN